MVAVSFAATHSNHIAVVYLSVDTFFSSLSLFYPLPFHMYIKIVPIFLPIFTQNFGKFFLDKKRKGN
jgi:hypothetical protein